jgi:hypothetical protein
MENNWNILALPKELQRVIFEMLPLRVLARYLFFKNINGHLYYRAIMLHKYLIETVK